MARFETLLATAPPDQEDLLPTYPTFAQRFKAQEKSPYKQEGKPESRSDQPSIWQSISSAGQQVSRLFTEVRIHVDRKVASFGPLPSLLIPAEAPLPATRNKAKSFEAKPPTPTLPLPSPEHDLAINLKVGPVSGDKATLSVQARQISSQQPLNRVRVTLKNTNNQALESNLTPEDGTVTFQNIEPASYLVEVRYRGQVWELPITFALAPENSDAPSG
jgi:hypothetical protein